MHQLQQASFSQEQIAGLLTLRALSIQRASERDEPQRKREEFIRWLYLQGRLQS
jgi:hypothetical protein